MAAEEQDVCAVIASLGSKIAEELRGIREEVAELKEAIKQSRTQGIVCVNCGLHQRSTAVDKNLHKGTKTKSTEKESRDNSFHPQNGTNQSSQIPERFEPRVEGNRNSVETPLSLACDDAVDEVGLKPPAFHDLKDVNDNGEELEIEATNGDHQGESGMKNPEDMNESSMQLALIPMEGKLVTHSGTRKPVHNPNQVKPGSWGEFGNPNSMDPELNTVIEVWKEYSEGINGKLSIIERQNKVPNWRKLGKVGKNFFFRRKEIWASIEYVAKELNTSNNAVAAMFQSKQEKHDWSLGQVRGWIEETKRLHKNDHLQFVSALAREVNS